MIRSFHDKLTAAIFRGHYVSGVHQDIQQQARKKLQVLDKANSLNDLKGVGYSLEKLVGNRKGQWSIRVTGKWRISFAWQNGQADDVELSNHYG
jgi:proteic killer suppression protein